jgi:CheY-like chemotaxis protein
LRDGALRCCAGAGIAVRDNGQGIAADLLPHVFDAFRQGERSLDRAQGAGHWPDLVKRIIDVHGGRIEAFSEGAGRGAEFVLRLLLASAAPLAESCAPVIELRQTPRRHVLVVDENADAAELLMHLLRDEGHAMMTALDADSALRIAGSFKARRAAARPRPAAAFRDRPKTRDALIASVTGYGSQADLRKSKEAGFDHHLVKPVDSQQLTAVLAGMAGRGTHDGAPA